MLGLPAVSSYVMVSFEPLIVRLVSASNVRFFKAIELLGGRVMSWWSVSLKMQCRKHKGCLYRRRARTRPTGKAWTAGSRPRTR